MAPIKERTYYASKRLSISLRQAPLKIVWQRSLKQFVRKFWWNHQLPKWSISLKMVSQIIILPPDKINKLSSRTRLLIFFYFPGFNGETFKYICIRANTVKTTKKKDRKQCSLSEWEYSGENIETHTGACIENSAPIQKLISNHANKHIYLYAHAFMNIL